MSTLWDATAEFEGQLALILEWEQMEAANAMAIKGAPDWDADELVVLKLVISLVAYVGFPAFSWQLSSQLPEM